MGIRYAEKSQIVPLYAPAATTDDVESALVKMKNVQHLSFLVMWGVLAADTDFFTLTVKSADTNSTGSGDVALPFKYRLASAVATDSWGAITDATAAGVAVLGTQDGKGILIDVDPSIIPALDANAENVYLDIASNAEDTYANAGFAIWAIIEPRYPQNANLSSTGV